MVWVDIVGYTVLAVAAFLLWLGSLEIPWSIRTIDGVSEMERTFERRRNTRARLGLGLLASGYALQVVLRVMKTCGG